MGEILFLLTEITELNLIRYIQKSNNSIEMTCHELSGGDQAKLYKYGRNVINA